MPLGLLFGLSKDNTSLPQIPQGPGRAANTSAVTLPRVGVLESKGFHLWVIHKISNQLSDVARSAIERVQYATLGKNMMPGLHRAATLAFVSFVTRNMKPLIVLACWGMIEDRSRKTCAEQILLVNIPPFYALPYTAILYCLPLLALPLHCLVYCSPLLRAASLFHF
jgi:hypothetical protein